MKDIRLNYCFGAFICHGQNAYPWAYLWLAAAADWVDTDRLWNMVSHAVQQSRESTEQNRITQQPQLQKSKIKWVSEMLMSGLSPKDIKKFAQSHLKVNFRIVTLVSAKFCGMKMLDLWKPACKWVVKCPDFSKICKEVNLVDRKRLR